MAAVPRPSNSLGDEFIKSDDQSQFSFTLLPSPSTIPVPHDTPTLLLFPVRPQNPVGNSEHKTLILNPGKTAPALSLDLSLSINQNHSKNKRTRLQQVGSDPLSLWKIKNFLTTSDLGNLSRLMVASQGVQNHIIPFLDAEAESNLCKEEGLKVRMWDCDTKTEHPLVMRQWSSNKSYLFNGNWIKGFVRRRGLQLGDQIGLFWDQDNSRFNFNLLRRA